MERGGERWREVERRREVERGGERWREVERGGQKSTTCVMCAW
jgi:hypothetical protein